MFCLTISASLRAPRIAPRDRHRPSPAFSGREGDAQQQQVPRLSTSYSQQEIQDFESLELLSFLSTSTSEKRFVLVLFWCPAGVHLSSCESAPRRAKGDEKELCDRDTMGPLRLLGKQDTRLPSPNHLGLGALLRKILWDRPFTRCSWRRNASTC